MNPIESVDKTQVALSNTPEQLTESDIVRSPGTGNTVRFGLAEDGAANTVLKLKQISEDSPATETSLDESIEKLNSEMRQRRISLSFSVDESTDSVIVRVVDSSSGKVIRQIPPDELLALRRRFEDLTGMLLDKHI